MAQIEVEGSIIGSTPWIGPLVQRILIGGDEVGHLTLTHLYFLHVALLPLLVGGLLIVHISQVYRYGLSRNETTAGSPEVPYWPYQTIRNMLVLAAVLSVVAILAWQMKAPLECAGRSPTAAYTAAGMVPAVPVRVAALFSPGSGNLSPPWLFPPRRWCCYWACRFWTGVFHYVPAGC